MKLADFYEKFIEWFRHELSDMYFIWNLAMIAVTDGWWLFAMVLYYTFRRN